MVQRPGRLDQCAGRMIPYTTCVCQAASRWVVVQDPGKRRGAISVERTEPHAVFIQMVGPIAPARAPRHLSDSDWLLLETLDTSCQRPLHTGRFLTMHKRRRKRLTTRTLTQEPALLDDIHHGQVQCVLDRVWQWPFNAFTLDTVTGGRSLPVLCVHLFHWYGLMDHFNLDVVRVWKLFTLVEEGYHSTNPYHNSIHATDVTQAMHCFLQEEKIKAHLTPLEVMSSLIAAVTHDLDHPGVNQPFLIATSNHLAALYENTSVLENHHWRSAVGCLLESHVAEQLGACRPELQRQISELILATDITRQQEFLTRFKRYLDQDLLDLRRAEDRHFVLQIALKCADISNPCRPWDVSRKWSLKVCEEFFRQGDYERRLNLPVTSLCDRQTTSIPKIQAGFFRFVVAPLFEEWHRFLGTELSTRMMRHLHGNQGRWEALVQAELAEETRTEISEAEVLDEEDVPSSEDDAELLLPESPTARRPSLPCRAEERQRVGRRHSVPLSVPRPPPFARTIIRRESLPVPAGEQRAQRRFLRLDEEEDAQLGRSSLSLLSACSSGAQHASGGGSQEERPVSAENLLPEPSIASITTSLEASRLSCVLHGASRLLTRQQTFPPLQPYVRVRYMSTTAEMSSCSEVPADSSSSSTLSPCGRNGCGTPNGRGRTLREQQAPARTKREQTDAVDKAAKVARVAEKENVDPLRRSTTQGLTRRRGSAPVGLLNRSDDCIVPVALALRGGGDRFLRRGSVPIDVTRQSVLRPLENSVSSPPHCMLPRRSSLPYLLDPLTIPAAGDKERNEGNADDECSRRLDPQGTMLLTKPLEEAFLPNVRRGSIPADLGNVARNGSNGKSRTRKKVLRRRSSGGPEMFSASGCEPFGDGAATWQRWRRRTAEQLLARRRGSLPIEVLATHSVGPARRTCPSLWRL
ncbi:uncharacterized protein [Periplaneta americana]|uniref:uncharacterized protein isoform X3 n=1 Tax=Periplaneta americana TaxID=6978 RepID=UPI0037E7D3E0